MKNLQLLLSRRTGAFEFVEWVQTPTTGSGRERGGGGSSAKMPGNNQSLWVSDVGPFECTNEDIRSCA